MKKITAILLLCFLVAACSKGNGNVVAEVNGTKIYAADVENIVSYEKQKYDPIVAGTPESMKRLTQAALEVLIQEALLLDEAKRTSVTVSNEDLDNELKANFGTAKRGKIKDTLKEHNINTDFWLRTQKNKLIIRELVKREVVDTIPVNDAEIKAYYSKNKKEFAHGKQYRARQILTDSLDRAKEIKTKLNEGASFEELAKKYSLSPDSERGGDLGFFNTQDFPPAFSEICSQLDVNEISDIKKTDYGYQIFQLLGTRPPKTLTLAEVRPQIIDLIRHERSGDVFTGWFDGLRARGTIVINEEALQEVSTHEQTSKK